MSEVNRKNLSISFRVDNGIVEHNNRDFIAKNVDRERIGNNIIYCKQDIRQVYNALFGQALEDYNTKQTRADRKISDYYEHIRKDERLKPFYEVVVQFGDVESCGLKSGNWEKAKLMLDEYMKSFEKRNSNLKVFNAVMHLDEATPHLHIDFVPITHSSTRGLSVKVSMKGALKEQGFTSANRFQNEWSAWEEREREVMSEILRSHDLSRDVKNVHRAHLSVDEYKEVASAKEKIHEINAHINELKKKSPLELTADDFQQLNNQNDFLRSEVLKRDEKIAALSKKVGAKFVPFGIYSEDKVQFIAAELTKIDVPFVEENLAVYIPDYAQKTVSAIAESYRPAKSDGVRDKIRMDIDLLALSATSLEDLLTKLQERGYEIKRGKYLAVKPKFAERFVRLKTLGDDYVPSYLEKRITDRDKFPNGVRTKYENTYGVEKALHGIVYKMSVEIRQFRLAPSKDKPSLFYTYQNDKNINYLARQLKTVSEFGITSREQMYAKADELKRGIDDKTAKLKELSVELPTLKSEIAQLRHFFSIGTKSQRLDAMEQTKLAAAREIADKYGVKSAEQIAALEERLARIPNEVATIKSELSDEQTKLKRISDLIAVYEKVVEGNYIDNLIRGQKEKDKTIDNSNLIK